MKTTILQLNLKTKLLLICAVVTGLAPGRLSAQTAPYVFTTLAGKAGKSGTNDEPGVAARFNGPFGVAIDQAKNLYVADTGNDTIRKIAFNGAVSTLAGSPKSAGSADGIGGDAQFNHPTGVAVDLSGNVYVADWGNHAIREITAGGTVSTIAGLAGKSGTNDGVGNLARFNHPAGVAVDSLGNVYVADEWNHTIRKLTLDGVNWNVTTVAGSPGKPGSLDGTDRQARFNLPAGITVDGDGNLFVSDSGNNTVRRVVKVSSVWTTSTVAGLPGNSGSADGLNEAARFDDPIGVAVDDGQNVYVADFGNQTIRRITLAGVVSTLAGTAGSSGSANGLAGDNVPSWATAAAFNSPAGLAVDASRNIYIAEVGNHTIREGAPAIAPVILEQPQSVTTIPGTDAIFTTTVAGEEPLLFQWKLNGQDLASSGAGGIDFSLGEGDIGTYTLSMEATSPYGSVTSSIVQLTVTAANAFVTLAGSGGSAGYADGPGPLAQFNRPGDLVLDSKGNAYVADAFNDVIRKITANGMTTTIAGKPGVYGYADGVGTNAIFQTPYGITMDTNGNLFVADTFNYAIRKMVSDGTNWTVSTFAGSPGNAGTNDGPGLSGAKFNEPINLTVDGANNLYVADYEPMGWIGSQGNIRKITPDGSVTSTNVGGAFLREGLATGLALDPQGNIFAADSGLSIIWKHTAEFAGGSSIYPGTTDGPANTARFNQPEDVVVDKSNNVYVADTGSSTIRKITNGVVTTIAGNPPLTNSYGEVIDSDGNVVLPGNLIPGGFADGVGTNALFNSPFGIALDKSGLVYVADTFNHAIRKEWPSFFITAQPGSQTVQVNSDVTFSVVAAADSDLSYQWFTNGTAIPDATTADYTIHGVQSIAAGDYTVVVSNDVSSLTSDVATLKVLVPPIITTQPQSETVSNGDPAAFSVVVAGTAPFSYQWLYDGVPLPGQTKTNLAISLVGTNDLGLYSVAVTGPGGDVASDAAILSFHEPTIIVPPQDQTVTAGSAVTFSVVAGGDGPLTYQWFFNDVAITGATGDTYTISDPQTGNAGAYTVTVSDLSGNTASSDFRLTVSSPPGAQLFVADSGSGLIYEYSSGGDRGVFALGTDRPYGIAADGAGNLFVANFDGGIYQLTPDGTRSTFASLFNGPAGLAVDSADNLFVGVSGNGYIYEYAPDGTQSTFGQEPDVNGYSYGNGEPQGLAFDAAGNLFASDTYFGRIYRGVPQPGSFFASLDHAWGLAFDSSGDLFVSDTYDGNIYKFANVNGTLGSSYTTFATGLSEPTGLAFDSQDNLFVADYLAGTIYKFAPNGSRTTFASGLLAPTALAFGRAGLPRAIFSASPTNGLAPVSVAFNAPNVDSLGNAITSWTWKFGDGSTGTGQNPTHTYITAGEFVPHLVATNRNGATAFGSGPLITVSLPTVAFTAVPTNGVNPLAVQFTAPTVDSGGTTITDWTWDFGDGTIGRGQNPAHVYVSEGSFQPTLIATNDNGVAVLASGPAISASPWVQKNSPTGSALYGVTVGHHRLVAVGYDDNIITSDDGQNWSADTVPGSPLFLNGVTYANGLFVATGDEILTSTDGINWTQQTSGVTGSLPGIAFGDGLFVAAGDNGIVTSPDGVNWTEQTNSPADGFKSVAFNNGEFVAVGGSGAIWTSLNGTNWASQNSPISDNLAGVTAGGHQFVAVSDYGEIITSPDGTNWTQQTFDLEYYISLNAVCYGNGHFIAVGNLDDAGTLLLSTDGTNWISETVGASDTYYGASYYENGSFVIVGDFGVILFNQPPQLGQLTLLPGHTLQFSLNGLNGSTAIIETTPTLSPADWQPVATNVINNGVVTFTDQTTSRSLFYRARVQ